MLNKNSSWESRCVKKEKEVISSIQPPKPTAVFLVSTEYEAAVLRKLLIKIIWEAHYSVQNRVCPQCSFWLLLYAKSPFCYVWQRWFSQVRWSICSVCRGHRASSGGGYTGEWSQRNYSDIFVWYSERVFYLANWKVGVNHFAVSSHLWIQIGFESGRRACLPCLHQLPSLGHNHIFREAVSTTTAVCNNNSSTECSAHIFVQPRSLTAKAASLKATESRPTCRLQCQQL